MSRKKKFVVEDNETIDDCLNRMKKEGYFPVKRIEKPVFQEVKKGMTPGYEPVASHIVFEALKIE